MEPLYKGHIGTLETFIEIVLNSKVICTIETLKSILHTDSEAVNY